MSTRLSAVLCIGLLATGASVSAQDQTTAPEFEADVQALYDALDMPEVIDVMALEGAEYGEMLAESLFAGRPVPSGWSEEVQAIYDRESLGEEIRTALSEALEGEDVAAMLSFYRTEPGRTLASLEVSAREAMLDDEVEDAAKEAAAVAIAEDDPRIDLVRRYSEANDLIETNVVGALNGNVAYFMGMMDGGAMAGEQTEDDLLSGVWAQEPQIRADTTEWVMSYLLLAYGPASDADMEALIAFSETPEGQALNDAVFQAFNGVFNDISRSLGLASARYMTTEEL